MPRSKTVVQIVVYVDFWLRSAHRRQSDYPISMTTALDFIVQLNIWMGNFRLTLIFKYMKYL